MSGLMKLHKGDTGPTYNIDLVGEIWAQPKSMKVSPLASVGQEFNCCDSTARGVTATGTARGARLPEKGGRECPLVELARGRGKHV